jgi:hypothetical protein
MVAFAQESLAKGKFKHPELIARNMEKIIRRSSIVSVFEKMRFRDFSSTLSRHDSEWLSSGLEELLHGNAQTGFEMILDLLKSQQLAKWSLMTVCQTYFHPQQDVFIKPTTVKGVIAYFELKHLQYRPTPSWNFYEAYRTTFHEMRSKVDKLVAPTNPAFSGFLLMAIHRDLL